MATFSNMIEKAKRAQAKLVLEVDGEVIHVPVSVESIRWYWHPSSAEHRVVSLTGAVREALIP